MVVFSSDFAKRGWGMLSEQRLHHNHGIEMKSYQLCWREVDECVSCCSWRL